MRNGAGQRTVDVFKIRTKCLIVNVVRRGQRGLAMLCIFAKWIFIDVHDGWFALFLRSLRESVSKNFMFICNERFYKTFQRSTSIYNLFKKFLAVLYYNCHFNYHFNNKIIIHFKNNIRQISKIVMCHFKLLRLLFFFRAKLKYERTMRRTIHQIWIKQTCEVSETFLKKT